MWYFHLVVQDPRFESEDASQNAITSGNQSLLGMDSGTIPVNLQQGALVCAPAQPSAKGELGSSHHKELTLTLAPNSRLAPRQGTAPALRSATDLPSSEELRQPTEPHNCDTRRGERITDHILLVVEPTPLKNMI